MLPIGPHRSHPALAADGTAVLWRHEELLAVTPDLSGVHRLHHSDYPQRPGTRTLLLPDGTVALAFDRELHLFRTSLPGPAEGPWTCADGSPEGNPAASPAG